MRHQLTLALVAAIALSPSLTQVGLAQARGHGSAPFLPGFRSGRNGSPFVSNRRYEFPGAYYLAGLPLFYDDYPLAMPAPESGPPVIVLQPQSSPDPASQLRPSPLLIELEGDRYVRYGGITRSAGNDENPQRGSRPQPVSPGDTASATQKGRTSNDARLPGPSSPPPGERTPSASANSYEARASQLAPTVLVYRDGHREQVPDYAIVGRVMYAHSIASDAQTGYGVKNIQLSELDLPATTQANRENGINFVIPAAPNEVVTRP